MSRSYGKFRWEEIQTGGYQREGLFHLIDSNRSFKIKFDYDDAVLWDNKNDVPDIFSELFDDEVLIRFDFDVHDQDEVNYYYGLEDGSDNSHVTDEEDQLIMRMPSMERVTCDSSKRGGYLMFDRIRAADMVTGNTSNTANNPRLTNGEIRRAVDRMYDYIAGWYDDTWAMLAMETIPIDPNTGEELHAYSNYVGGIESLVLDEDDQRGYLYDIIIDQISECEYMRKNDECPQQLAMPLHQPAFT